MQIRPLRALSLLALLLSSVGYAAQEPEYEIRRLPFPSGNKLRGVLNNSGVVAAMVNVDGIYRGYRFDGTSVTELGVPAGTDPELLRIQFIVDINASGVIAGHHDLGPGKRPVVWEDGIPRELPMPNDGELFWVSGINDSGQVAGSGWPFASFSPGWIGENGWDEEPAYRTNRDPMRPVLWDADGELQYVPFPVTRSIDAAGVRLDAINDAGELLCWQWDHNRIESFHLIPGKGTVRLSRLGFRHCLPAALNSKGEIAGSLRNSGYDERPVLWDKGVATDLGFLPGYTKGTCVDINEAGVVLGQMGWSFEGNSTLFRWRDGEMVDLQTLIRPGAGWDMSEAYAINDKGWILGLGTFEGIEQELFLLLPTDNNL